jgi:putative restriction endonuclease
MKTADDIRKLFSGIRMAPGTTGRFAPHKPLLLLLTLARLQRGEPGRFTYESIEADLKTLLTEFGPSNAPKTRNMPFWFLQNDGSGQLWSVKVPEELVDHPKGTAPTFGELRKYDVEGGLSSEVEVSLKNNPQLLVELARGLLETTFPETLHQDLASAVGLDLSPVDVGVQFQSPQYVTTRKKRDKAFREKVLRAYEYRCCVCGFDLRIGHIPAGLEAAHIQWHTVGGPDIEPNGLSLCALHHKLFDLGAFTLEPNSLKVLFSEHAISGSRGMTGELRFHGQDLLAPQASDVRPSPEFLHWNWTNVFKQKPRSST